MQQKMTFYKLSSLEGNLKEKKNPQALFLNPYVLFK